ncbi:MAG: flavodoxin domain-containing protein, partial [Calditrichaceae bacterium]
MDLKGINLKNIPFKENQADWLNRLLQTVTPEQIAWLAGYFTAINSMPSADNAVMSPAADAVRDKNNPDEKITILYGSQTGNGERISSQLLARLKEAGYQAELKNMLDYRPNQLKNEKFLLIVVSTHGEGDPPDNAVEFYEYLHSKRAPKLDKLDYSVLALGDTSYEHFCKTGRDFDSRLSE